MQLGRFAGYVEAPFKFFFGDDIFVSYSRADGINYALGLADEFEKRKFSCRVDLWGSAPGPEIPKVLKRAIRWSKVLVLIGTEGACDSPNVELEIDEYLKTGGPILPIDVDHSVEKARWYSKIAGLPLTRETDSNALVTGKASEGVISRIKNSANFTKRNQRALGAFLTSLALFVILVLLNTYLFASANGARSEATRLALLAKEAEEEAEKQMLRVADARDEAAKQASLAEQANVRRFAAEERTRVAEREEIVARANAQEQEKVAFSLHLANEAELARTQHANLLTRSGLLAIESISRYSSLSADQVLRRGLSLLARPVGILERTGKSAVMTACTFSANGEYLATVSQDGDVWVWDVVAKRVVTQMSLGEGVLAVAFSRDGHQLITLEAEIAFFERLARYDKSVRVWQTVGGRQLSHKRHEGAPTERVLAFSADGRYLSSVGPDGAAHVFEALSGREITPRMRNGEFVAAFSSDSRHGVVVSPAERGSSVTMRIVELSSGRDVVNITDEAGILGIESMIELYRGLEYPTIAFSFDGRYLATLDGDANARVWNAKTGREVARVKNDFGNTLALSADGKYLAIGNIDGTGRVWDVITLQEVARVSLPARVTSIAFSPAGLNFATVSSGQARLWQAITQQEAKRIEFGPDLPGVDTTEFSPDARYLVTSRWIAENQYIFRVIEADTRKEIIAKIVTRPIRELTFSYDNRYLAGMDDSQATVWDLTTATEIARVPCKSQPLALALSRDARYLAVAGSEPGRSTNSSGSIVTVWDTARAKPTQVAHNSKVLTVAFSPDNKYFATGGEDGLVCVWFVRGAQKLASLPHNNAIRAVEFDVSSKYVASADGAGAHLWKISTRKKVVVIAPGWPALLIALSPDGRFLAVANRTSSSAGIWQVSNGREVSRLAHDGDTSRESGSSRISAQLARQIHAIAFSRDGRYFITKGNSSVRLHLWQPRHLVDEACSRLPRNLTADEWRLYLNKEKYRKTCVNLPEPNL